MGAWDMYFCSRSTALVRTTRALRVIAVCHLHIVGHCDLVAVVIVAIVAAAIAKNQTMPALVVRPPPARPAWWLAEAQRQRPTT